MLDRMYEAGQDITQLLVKQSVLESPEADISIIGEIRSYISSISEFSGKALTLFLFEYMPDLYLDANADKIMEFNGYYFLHKCGDSGKDKMVGHPDHCFWKCSDNIYYAKLGLVKGLGWYGGPDSIRLLIVTEDSLGQLSPFMKELAKYAVTEFEMRQEAGKGRRGLDSVFLPGDQLEEIKSEIGSFLVSKDLYTKELNLSWKRGLILHGPPGNGKTLMLRTIANDYGLPLADFKDAIGHNGKVNLKRLISYYRNPLIDVFYPERIKPVLVYLEDIDKLAPKSKRISSEMDEAVVPLQAVLNAIDGVEEVENGCLFVATVNEIGELSEALMRRPGRFDSVYEIGNPDAETILRFWQHHEFAVYDRLDSDERDDFTPDLAAQFAKEGMSMAFVEEMVKACRMIHKRKAVTLEEAQKIHNKFKAHLKEFEKVSEDYNDYSRDLFGPDQPAERTE